MEKRCPKCGETKPLEQFGRNKASKDGLQSSCKSCHARSVRESTDRHPDRVTASRQVYQQTERYKAAQKLRYARWKAKKLATDPEALRRWEADKAARWRKANPEKQAAAQKRWNDAHPEHIQEYPNRFRAKKLGLQADKLDYAAIAERDQDICHICKEPVDLAVDTYHPRSRTFDHVIPLVKGGPHTADNVKVAHRLCNVRKDNLTRRDQE